MMGISQHYASMEWTNVNNNSVTTGSSDDCKESAADDDNVFASLNWKKWKLCGRENELKRLEECYLKRKDYDLVLITGPLGVGKSALTNSLQVRVKEDLGLLVRGTFSGHSQEPYEALSQLFTDLVSQLQLKDDYELIRSDIKQAISQTGAERFLIPDSLSILETLMNDDDDNEDTTKAIENNQSQTISATDRQHRLVGAVTKIIEAIGTCLPLVIVLDNLMWADPGSIFLLESLCTTAKLSNVLIVATCRDDVGYQDLLSVKLRSMEDRRVRLIDIPLNPFTLEDTQQFIQTLIGRKLTESVCSQLASRIQNSTGGVPLLICESLAILEKEGLNSNILQEHRSYSDFVTQKIITLPRKSQQILKIMACLGGRAVHESVLVELTEGGDESDIHNAILAAQDNGLIILHQQDGECSFLHGSIQNAVYNLISETERTTIHYGIARSLSSWLIEKQLEENIFLVVDQYLKGRDHISENEAERVSELCLVAARKAACSAAFSSTGEYIRFGLSLLPARSRWRDNYDLTLALTNAAVEVEFCNGNHEEVDMWHQEVLQHARNIMDTMTSYATHISSLGTRGDHTKEAVEEGFYALKRLGVKIPCRMVMFRTVTSLIKTKKMLKKTTDKEIVDLPPLIDPKIQAASNILHLLFVYLFLQQSDLVPLVAIKAIDFTLQYGLNPMSK